VHEIAQTIVPVQELQLLTFGCEVVNPLIGAEASFADRPGVEVPKLRMRDAAHLALAGMVRHLDELVDRAFNPNASPVRRSDAVTIGGHLVATVSGAPALQPG
jgi:hypothetical protein